MVCWIGVSYCGNPGSGPRSGPRLCPSVRSHQPAGRSQRVRKRTRQCRGPFRGPTPTSSKNAANMRIGRTVNHGLRDRRLLLRQHGSGPRSGPRLCPSVRSHQPAGRSRRVRKESQKCLVLFAQLPRSPRPRRLLTASSIPNHGLAGGWHQLPNYSTAKMHRMHKLRHLDRIAAFDLKRSQKCLALFASQANAQSATWSAVCFIWLTLSMPW